MMRAYIEIHRALRCRVRSRVNILFWAITSILSDDWSRTTPYEQTSSQLNNYDRGSLFAIQGRQRCRNPSVGIFEYLWELNKRPADWQDCRGWSITMMWNCDITNSPENIQLASESEAGWTTAMLAYSLSLIGGISPITIDRWTALGKRLPSCSSNSFKSRIQQQTVSQPHT